MKNRFLILSCTLVILVYILLAGVTDQTIQVIAANETISPSRTVIIDAGHGGEDGGATSCTGALESGINLDISLRLKDLLTFLGYPPMMTRTADSSIHSEGSTIAQRKVSDLRNRVELVNKTEKPLLISIHQNYFTNSRYYGAQVFYASTADSRILAEKIQNNFLNTINPGSKRMPKYAENIYLMEQIHCDGVLVECGFLSNSREEQLLRNEAYQKKICAVIASAVSIYLQDASLLT